MKKRLRTLFTILLTVALLFSAQASFVVRAEDEITFVEDLFEDEEFMEEFEEFLIAHHGKERLDNLDQARQNDADLMALFSSFETKGPVYYTSNDAVHPDVNEPVYPDFIGGIYYNDDGNMVLQIVNETAAGNEEQWNAVQNYIDKKGIIVESVQFSQNEITATMNTLSALYQADNRPDALDNVDSIAEDTSGNRVEIRMRVFNEEEIARFKETVLDSPVLAFVQSSGPVEPCLAPRVNFLGGASNQMGGSIGYRAKLNGMDGFVTHGHGLSNGRYMYVAGTKYGTVIRQKYSGTVDAAFVQTTSRGIPSNSHSGGGAVSTVVQTTFRKGNFIAKIGNASGKTTGSVTNPSVIANNIFGLVETDCWAQPGDSGGLVIGPNNTTAGITEGIINGNNMLFCRADVINSYWGLVRY